MKGMVEQIASIQRALDVFAREAQRQLSVSSEGALERAGEPIGPLFRRAHRAIHEAAGAIEAACGHLRMDLASVADAVLVEALVLTAVHDAEDGRRARRLSTSDEPQPEANETVPRAP